MLAARSVPVDGVAKGILAAGLPDSSRWNDGTRASFVAIRPRCRARGPGGASIPYDRPSSFLGALGHPELSWIGVLLDGKIDDVAHALCTA
jgi:hypothetical protein